MTNPNPKTVPEKVLTYAQVLFQHGLETYDANTKATANQGGAKLFFQVNWKDGKGALQFNYPRFRELLKELECGLYTLSRVETDDKGKLVHLKDDPAKFSRIQHGLLAYMQQDADPRVARDAVARICEAYPILKGFVAIASDLVDQVPKIQELTTQKVRDPMNEWQPMKLHAAIILALPSGPPGGAQFWSFDATKIRSRSAMSASTTASDTEVGGGESGGDLPF